MAATEVQQPVSFQYFEPLYAPENATDAVCSEGEWQMDTRDNCAKNPEKSEESVRDTERVDLPAPPSGLLVPCRFFAAGLCTRGDSCRFYHQSQDAFPYSPAQIESPGSSSSGMYVFSPPPMLFDVPHMPWPPGVLETPHSSTQQLDEGLYNYEENNESAWYGDGVYYYGPGDAVQPEGTWPEMYTAVDPNLTTYPLMDEASYQQHFQPESLMLFPPPPPPPQSFVPLPPPTYTEDEPCGPATGSEQVQLSADYIQFIDHHHQHQQQHQHHRLHQQHQEPQQQQPQHSSDTQQSQLPQQQQPQPHPPSPPSPPISTSAPSSSFPFSSSSQHQGRKLCHFYTEGTCRFGRTCRNEHGDECPICLRKCLPSDASRRQEHLKRCVPTADRDVELSSVVECGVCYENPRARNDRFGILNNCEHVFCLACIRSWRGTDGPGKRTVRGCPICRIESHFVIPSDRFVPDGDDKRALIAEYKANMRTIPCKHFSRSSRGSLQTCPFGNVCFYAHLKPTAAKKQKPRQYVDANGALTSMRTVRLSDFISL
mmetsp:Transcript_12842/g.20988  ORF Transcript_12842/g.20988 Transcript_12842/m.20988 type:complete len:541 (+) Transcript_12842:97-1719(+)